MDRVKEPPANGRPGAKKPIPKKKPTRKKDSAAGQSDAGDDWKMRLATEKLVEDGRRAQLDHAHRCAAVWLSVIRDRIEELYCEVGAMRSFLDEPEAAPLAEVLDPQQLNDFYLGIADSVNKISGVYLATHGAPVPNVVREFLEGPPVE